MEMGCPGHVMLGHRGCFVFLLGFFFGGGALILFSSADVFNYVD